MSRKTRTLPRQRLRASMKAVTVCSMGIVSPLFAVRMFSTAGVGPLDSPAGAAGRSARISARGSFQDIALIPPRKAFSQRVHEGDAVFDIGGDDTVADALEDRRQPLFPFPQGLVHFGLVKGHLDRRLQFAFVEGLEEIAERLGHLGPGQGRFVGIGRQVDDGDFIGFPNPFGGDDPVDFPLEHDIHQNEIGVAFPQRHERFFTGGEDVHDFIAQPAKHILDVLGHQAFVLHDQDFDLRHRASSIRRYFKPEPRNWKGRPMAGCRGTATTGYPRVSRIPRTCPGNSRSRRPRGSGWCLRSPWSVRRRANRPARLLFYESAVIMQGARRGAGRDSLPVRPRIAWP